MQVHVVGGILCALMAGVGLAALRAQPAERVSSRTALGLVLRQRLWRQLPAGTTGAYQLLANLLSLGGS